MMTASIADGKVRTAQNAYRGRYCFLFNNNIIIISFKSLDFGNIDRQISLGNRFDAIILCSMRVVIFTVQTSVCHAEVRMVWNPNTRKH